MSTYRDWLRGDPEALEAGGQALADAFHTGSSDIRQAVATWQKRHGHTPTGWLSPEQWDELTAPAESTDPADYTVAQVLEYLAVATPENAAAMIAQERAGKARRGILDWKADHHEDQ